MNNAFNHVIAFDVAKHSLAVHILPGDESHTIENKPKVIRKLLIAQMRRNANLGLGPLLVVCEATGGYERHLLEVCEELRVATHKAHGSRVRHFAKYLGLIAKNDPIDARVLALYGLKTENLRLHSPLAPELAALLDLRARRDQIQAMLLAETNRLEHVRHASVTRNLKEHIAILRKALAAIEAKIAAHFQASEALARKAALMGTLKGIGPRQPQSCSPTCQSSAHSAGPQQPAWLALPPSTTIAAKQAFPGISRQAEPQYARPYTWPL